MSIRGLIRLEPNGPAGIGMTALELEPEDFQSALPKQNWHIYFEDPEIGLTVGVWTTTSMQEAFGPYPGDEFMHLLEGEVAILDHNDEAVRISQGETFVVRNGIPVSWKQVGFCRKFFMTYLSPIAPAPEIADARGGVSILRETDLESNLETGSENSGQSDAVCFENDTGNMTAGMWESEPFESPMSPFPSHELAQILEGKVSITEASGETHEFAKGDFFFIPEGTVCSWKASVPIRKFYCSLMH